MGAAVTKIRYDANLEITMGKDNTDPPNLFDLLVESRKRRQEGFITFLVGQLQTSQYTPSDLQDAVAAMRAALAVQFRARTDEDPTYRCSFCSKSRKDVRTLMVSGESTICDECADMALETISRGRGQIFLRIGYFVFRIIASFGIFLPRKKQIEK